MLEVKYSYVMSMQHDAYIYVNNDRTAGTVTIGASTLDDTQQVKLDEVKNALASYEFIEFGLNNLTGKILTLCDAALSDPIQRKAFKDVIRNHVADAFHFYSSHMQRELIEDSLKEVENMSDEQFAQWQKDNPPVDIDEVICPDK